jgi:hypothetical protein
LRVANLSDDHLGRPRREFWRRFRRSIGDPGLDGCRRRSWIRLHLRQGLLKLAI